MGYDPVGDLLVVMRQFELGNALLGIEDAIGMGQFYSRNPIVVSCSGPGRLGQRQARNLRITQPRPDEQAHFDVVRIPCHELHEAEVVAMDPLDEDAFPLPGAPVEIARDSCGISAEIGAAEVGAVAALLSARVVDTNAFVPRGSDALGNGEGGVYCVAARRCESALVGLIAGAGEIRQRSEPVEGCFNDDRFVIHENGSGPDPATLEESYQRVDL